MKLIMQEHSNCADCSSQRREGHSEEPMINHDNHGFISNDFSTNLGVLDSQIIIAFKRLITNHFSTDLGDTQVRSHCSLQATCTTVEQGNPTVQVDLDQLGFNFVTTQVVLDQFQKMKTLKTKHDKTVYGVLLTCFTFSGGLAFCAKPCRSRQWSCRRS